MRQKAVRREKVKYRKKRRGSVEKKMSVYVRKWKEEVRESVGEEKRGRREKERGEERGRGEEVSVYARKWKKERSKSKRG